MLRLQMKCLLFTEIMLLMSCASAYRNLQTYQGDADCLKKFQPKFTTNWFKATVDVFGKHIGGLLLIKKMPDSSMRVNFMNETGISFLDFEFHGSEFKVHNVMKALDKNAVINTLRKDFELILMDQINAVNSNSSERNQEVYYFFPENKEKVYFVTNMDCSTLLRVERTSKLKLMVEANFVNPDSNGVPDSVHISHFTFDMQITLKKLEL